MSSFVSEHLITINRELLQMNFKVVDRLDKILSMNFSPRQFSVVNKIL